MEGKIDILLGAVWGDEGKGKVVDYLTPNYDVVCRFQGGSNAGHTIKFGDTTHVLHLIPSGIFNETCQNVIGNGVVIDPIDLVNEIIALEAKGIDVKSRLSISDKAHLILPVHKLADKMIEDSKGESKIGSTLKGIGPAYTHKVSRNGIRVGDIFKPTFESELRNLILDWNKTPENKIFIEACNKLKGYNIIDTTYYLNNQLNIGKSILAEGAQGALLDVDFGTYPYVTSSNTTVGGVFTGLGVPPTKVGKIIGIFKAYTTRVGSGPFPTELKDDVGENLRTKGTEFGSTTGRPRRCGWLDLPLLKYSCMINGITELHIMKLDVLSSFNDIKICTSYKKGDTDTREVPQYLEAVEPNYESLKGWDVDLVDITNFENLPSECQEYLSFIENYLKIPIKLVSVGPDRLQTIIR